MVDEKNPPKNELNAEAYHITQEKGTEPAFTGKLLAEKRDGAYDCIVCGAELFSSEAKYDSGSGWPSFWDKISKDAIEEIRDTSHGMERIEVVCKNCKAHLGHVFPDGPQDKTGLRYCINSAALNFTAADEDA